MTNRKKTRKKSSRVAESEPVLSFQLFPRKSNDSEDVGRPLINDITSIDFSSRDEGPKEFGANGGMLYVDYLGGVVFCDARTLEARTVFPSTKKNGRTE